MEIEVVKKRLSKRHQGNTVGVLRNAVGLKQVDFGEIFGWRQSKVSDLESMEEIPEADLKIIADFFNVPVGFFDRFNFEEAIDSIIKSMEFNAKDNSVVAPNTAKIIEEVNYNQESPKLYELYEARIEDAKTIGELQERVRHLEEERQRNKQPGGKQ